MSTKDSVPRPRGRSEYEIHFDSSHARKGWGDLMAVRRNDLVSAWDFLTRNPETVTALSYPLKDSLSSLVRGGVTHTRWQLKLSATHGARIWSFVDGRKVHLEKVFTSHPNETL